MNTVKLSDLLPRNLKVDGKNPGDVLEFQISLVGEVSMCSIKYLVGGKERVLTVHDTSAISFEVEGKEND